MILFNQAGQLGLVVCLTFLGKDFGSNPKRGFEVGADYLKKEGKC